MNLPLTLRENECGACGGNLNPEYVHVQHNLCIFAECLICGCFNKTARKSIDMLTDFKVRDIEDPDKEMKRFEFMVDKLSKLTSDLEGINKMMYDVCCGSGALVKVMRNHGWSAGGCDIKAGHVNNALSVYGVRLDQNHFEHMILPKMNAVIFHHGIEHVAFPRFCLMKALRLLKKDGVVVMCHPSIPKGDGKLLLYADRSDGRSGGHGYEWTFDSFSWFVNDIRKEIEFDIAQASDSKETKQGIEMGIPPVQWWVLRRL